MDTFLAASSSYSQVGASKSDCSIGLEDGKKVGNTGQVSEKTMTKSSSPPNESKHDEENKLELAKAEMIQVREENTKLKKMLEQIESDFNSLHTRFANVMQRQQANKSSTEDTYLISLSLGRKEEFTKTRDTNSTLQLLSGEGLKLRTEFDLEQSKTSSSDKSCENSSQSEKAKEWADDRTEEMWPAGKVLKTTRSSENDEEAAAQPSNAKRARVSVRANAKRARVSVRARCDSVTMNDGCQWRKYGQKTAKNNPCPRAYYRCTVAPVCPVRKQVQRCMDDMSILITTYEGTHSHPLPASAANMATTTSAAASMMLSGSSTTTLPSISQGLNFSNNDYSRQTSFYLPNTSTPTITLDLTTPSRFSSSQINNLPSVWGNGYLYYGSTLPYNATPLSSQYYSSSYSGKSNQDSFQQILTETLTKAITSDPSLRSVINAAISSMVINGGENKSNIEKAPLQFSL